MDEQEEGLLDEEATFVVGGVEVNPAEHGYTAVHNYASYFWRPYLGNTAFALWELLLSFCYGDNNTAFPSIARLARMLTNSDHSRAVVTGRRKTAGANTFGVSETPKVLRSDGALDVLRRERLVQVLRQGDGPLSSYTFRVRKTLPVLRPEQVARLSSRLQHDHSVWLERRGIDPATYRGAFAPPGPAHPAGRSSDPAEPSPLCPGADRRCAPVLTPPRAAGTGPSARRTAREAPRTTGAVQVSTNNPQEESLPNHWWEDTLAELQPQLTRGTFELCLLRTKLQSFQGGVLTLRAAGPLPRGFLDQRLQPLIQRTLHSTSHGGVQEVVIE
jgi:hypothetical protein